MYRQGVCSESDSQRGKLRLENQTDNARSVFFFLRFRRNAHSKFENVRSARIKLSVDQLYDVIVDPMNAGQSLFIFADRRNIRYAENCCSGNAFGEIRQKLN